MSHIEVVWDRGNESFVTAVKASPVLFQIKALLFQNTSLPHTS